DAQMAHSEVRYSITNCVGTQCTIRFEQLTSFPPSFTIPTSGGDNTLHLSSLSLENYSPFEGTIDLTTHFFTIPPQEAKLLMAFKLEDNPLSQVTLTNDRELHGVADPDDNIFLFNEDASKTVGGQDIGVQIRLRGTYADKGPPVAVLANQNVQCTSPNGA